MIDEYEDECMPVMMVSVFSYMTAVLRYCRSSVPPGTAHFSGMFPTIMLTFLWRQTELRLNLVHQTEIFPQKGHGLPEDRKNDRLEHCNICHFSPMIMLMNVDR